MSCVRATLTTLLLVACGCEAIASFDRDKIENVTAPPVALPGDGGVARPDANLGDAELDMDADGSDDDAALEQDAGEEAGLEEDAAALDGEASDGGAGDGEAEDAAPEDADLDDAAEAPDADADASPEDASN